uniref:UBN2_2 domain-containing protein n=1 Tax=Tanacetum cinerariifolium TaxID=118510 RepID=A0A699GSX2_TANCI|nr:UBN2_2 domain-containing protein [Tanacetum cinerariifolium]
MNSHDSEESVTDSTGTDYTNGSAASEVENSTDPLINLSDVGKSQKDVIASEQNEFGELMSKGALESWLDENPRSSQNISGIDNERLSSARISIRGAGARDQVKLTPGVMDLDRALRIDPPAALTAESTSNQKRAIPDSENAKEYLSSIEKQFKRTLKAHASTLILKMLTTKYDRVSGVRGHIMIMSHMANKLKGMDMEIDEEEKHLKVEKPDVVHVATTNSNKRNGSLKGKEEERLKVENPDVVHVASTNSNKRKGSWKGKVNEKSELLDMFKTFKAEVKNQLDCKIKVVRLDRGGEYYGRHTDVSQAPKYFFDFCKDHGIINQYTMSGTSKKNGVAKRRNRTLLDMVHSIGIGQFRRIELQEAQDETHIIHVPILNSTPIDTSNDHLIAQDHPNSVEENEPNPEINVEPQETQQPLRMSQ